MTLKFIAISYHFWCEELDALRSDKTRFLQSKLHRCARSLKKKEQGKTEQDAVRSSKELQHTSL